MKVLSNSSFRSNSPLVATTGFFDGVHGGHRFLLSELKRLAQERDLPSAVITFAVHPRIVLQADFHPELLNTYEEKIRLLGKTGIDYCIVLDFDRSLAETPACDFIRELLYKKLNVTTLLVGYDHRFGHLRLDGFDKYAEYGARCGMEVVKTASYTDNGVTISSSKIRTLLHAGNIAAANALLGYNYTLKGRVVEGNKIGRTIGFPTANIAVADKQKLVPAFGAYAVWVDIESVKYKGMLYIGTRPTVDNGSETNIEVNIFDFRKDIYNKRIAVEFVDYIREDKKFSSLDELKMQLKRDMENVFEKLQRNN
ncbi:MAG: riboflavin biosynthesis protein RibF [Tannerella sp.]|nr:riboflavin biosynthesis protein RibF [Tannerella sp.]